MQKNLKLSLQWKKSISYSEGHYTLTTYVFGPCIMIMKSQFAYSPVKKWFLFDGVRFKTEHALITYVDSLVKK